MSIALDRLGDSRFGCTRDGPVSDDDDLDNWRASSSADTSTSSIGRNSEDDGDVSGRSSDGGGCDDGEVQSAYKGSLHRMDSLEEALPMRRGISGFYDGKSKSFTSLAEAAATSSMRDIAKPENAYTRRRRNLLALNHMWDKNRSFYAKANGGGIYKRSISSSKSTLALAVAMSSSESISSASEDSISGSSPGLPPLCPQTRASNGSLCPSSPPSPLVRTNFQCWRSFSTADIQQIPFMMANKSSCFSVGGRSEFEKHD